MAEENTAGAQGPCRVLICDFVGLKLDENGVPDCREVRKHIEDKGGVFHTGSAADAGELDPDRVHFFYLPHLSTELELLEETAGQRYDGVIAAATVIPKQSPFRLAGVRIGAGTGNMQSASWGGGDGRGGNAVLMNTPGINSRATAQMVMRTLLKVRPDLPLDALHKLVMDGAFDTGKDLWRFPTEKLEGKRLAVIGYGNIGREVARLAKAFLMEVRIFARPRHREWIEAEGFEFCETPQEAAAGADALSVHIGLGPLDMGKGAYANAGFVDEAILTAAADGAVLVNFDRGEVVEIAALERAMASGKVAFAAIDADIFLAEGKGASGPLAPYLPVAERYPGRVLLLPHAAADTDHPSRVAGAKQAVDQILDVIRERKVSNLKGDLPAGFSLGRDRAINGIGAVTADDLSNRLAGENLSRLLSAADGMATFLQERQQAGNGLPVDPAAARRFMADANRLAALLDELGLHGPLN
ncbi:NAD(P)-dependent oxidoreductase [Aquamicrobium soli]|uniref:NAD(P)-dependent oxidoreductase n=1 Tax=Aquamicrobium soli TaxID=1811518 RepID=A0ABV7KG53_9HYPH